MARIIKLKPVNPYAGHGATAPQVSERKLRLPNVPGANVEKFTGTSKASGGKRTETGTSFQKK